MFKFLFGLVLGFLGCSTIVAFAAVEIYETDKDFAAGVNAWMKKSAA